MRCKRLRRLRDGNNNGNNVDNTNCDVGADDTRNRHRYAAHRCLVFLFGLCGSKNTHTHTRARTHTSLRSLTRVLCVCESGGRRLRGRCGGGGGGATSAPATMAKRCLRKRSHPHLNWRSTRRRQVQLARARLARTEPRAKSKTGLAKRCFGP